MNHAKAVAASQRRPELKGEIHPDGAKALRRAARELGRELVEKRKP